MQPPLEDTQKIEFTALYNGTVTWVDLSASAIPHSAKLNGPAVALDMAVGSSAKFEIPENNGHTFPALELTFNGTTAAPYFTLYNSSDSPWSVEKPDVFIYTDPRTKKERGSVTISLGSDGILIVGTLDMGGEHG